MSGWYSHEIPDVERILGDFLRDGGIDVASGAEVPAGGETVSWTVDEVVCDEDGTVLQSRRFTIADEDIDAFREAYTRHNYSVPQRFIIGS